MTARVIPLGYPCDARAAQKAYLDRGDRDDAHAVQVERIEGELRTAYLAGLNGANVFLPFVGKNYHQQDTEMSQSVWETLLEDLDHKGIAPLMRDLLEHSECPKVAELKVALADRYAKYWAPELAEVRGSDEGDAA